MRTIDGVVGNVREDADLAVALEDHDATGTLERVEIDAEDRVKSRLRVRTDGGRDLGLVVDRPRLRDGDVLVAEDDCMVVVRFASRAALAVELPADAPPCELLALGHRIGNQHWDLAVRDGTAYVPLDADRQIVEDVVSEAMPAGATATVETVDGSLFVESDGDAAVGQHSHRADHGDHADDNDDGYSHDDHSHARSPHEHANEGSRAHSDEAGANPDRGERG